MEFSTLHIWSQ